LHRALKSNLSKTAWQSLQSEQPEAMPDTQPASEEEPLSTFYDETYGDNFIKNPQFIGMSNRLSLIAQFEHHAPNTDGRVAVLINKEQINFGNFISRSLYDSIPQEHRPALRPAGFLVNIDSGGRERVVGITYIPMILNDINTGKRFRVVLRTFVVKRLLPGMFISGHYFPGTTAGVEGCEYVCVFGNGTKASVKGIPFE